MTPAHLTLAAVAALAAAGAVRRRGSAATDPDQLWYHCGGRGPGEPFSAAFFGTGEGFGDPSMTDGFFFADNEAVAKAYCEYSETPYLSVVRLRGTPAWSKRFSQPGLRCGPFTEVFVRDLSQIEVVETIPVSRTGRTEEEAKADMRALILAGVSHLDPRRVALRAEKDELRRRRDLPTLEIA
jgi:hypothetical protein